jgi:hypothetical protein
MPCPWIPGPRRRAHPPWGGAHRCFALEPPCPPHPLTASPLPRLLASFSLQEYRRQPWRSLTALLAIALGVALGFAVHVINQSALDEFSRAVRSVNGQPDLEFRGMRASLPQPFTH